MTRPHKSFPMPDEIIIDGRHGKAINIPLQYLGYDSPLDVPPSLLKRILAKRKELGVVIADDFPDGYEEGTGEAHRMPIDYWKEDE